MLGRAAPLVIAFSLIAPAVQASPECMTKQEALREMAHEAHLLAPFEPLLE
jgi:hypothetical protein